MPSLSTRAHGVLDYALAGLLIAVPWLLGFAVGGAAMWIPVLIGAGLLLYSAFTDYELSVIKRIQMPAHLWLDAFAGVLLAISPWLWGFDQRVWIPHLVLGLSLVAAAGLTNTIPGYERRRVR